MGELAWQIIGISAAAVIAATLVCAGVAGATFWQRIARVQRKTKSSSTSETNAADSEILHHPQTCGQAHRELETRMKAVEQEWDETFAKLRKFWSRQGGDARWQGKEADIALQPVAGNGPVLETAKARRGEILRRSRVEARSHS